MIGSIPPLPPHPEKDRASALPRRILYSYPQKISIVTDGKMAYCID